MSWGRFFSLLWIFTLVTGLFFPAWAGDGSADDPGQAMVQKIRDIFSTRWIDSAADSRKALEPPKGDSSQTVQNGTIVKPENQEKRAPEDGPSNGPPPRSGATTKPPLWMPFCFLNDPAQDPTTINQNMKQVVDEYGQCGIAVEPFAFTIAPGYPTGNLEELNNLARQACDFNKAFGVRGAIQIGVADASLPARMCQEPGAQGCSTLCERLSVSLIAPGAGPQTAVHESLHSNCCGRLCVNAGQGTQGVGYDIDVVKNEGPIKWYQAENPAVPPKSQAKRAEPQLSEEACNSLREGASPNDGTHRWDPNKLTFYARAKDPAAYKPLNGQSFFAPKPKHPPKAGHPQGSGEEGGSVGSVSFDDSAKKGNSKGSDTKGNGGSASDGTTTADVRHQNGGLGADPTVNALLGNLQDIEAKVGDPNDLQFTNAPRGPASTAGGSSTGGRVVFDDNAKKNRSGGGGGSSGNVGNQMPLSSAGSTSGFDGGGGSDLGINGASAIGGGSLDGNFFGQIKETQGDTSGDQRRGSTLRAKDLSAIKRQSQTGLSKRTDVLISARPDPGRIADEQKPTDGAY